MTKEKKAKSKVVVNVGSESMEFLISWADLFDELVLQPLIEELRKEVERDLICIRCVSYKWNKEAGEPSCEKRRSIIRNMKECAFLEEENGRRKNR